MLCVGFTWTAHITTLVLPKDCHVFDCKLRFAMYASVDQLGEVY
jgi:hypothetical protein